MPIVCQCAVVACGGSECPIKRIAADFAAERGEKLNPHNIGERFLLMREYYRRTTAEHEQKTGAPVARCGYCSPTITQEFIDDYEGKPCLEPIQPET